MNIKELINKKIAILWFWREGKSSLNFLKNIWVRNITILDNSEIKDKEENISYKTWENYLKDLLDYDYIIKSPWISLYKEEVYKFKGKIISQTSLFFDNYAWKVIWITWTKWKSTTSTLTYKCLESLWYKVKLVWNIGKPVLDEFKIEKWKLKVEEDFIVYELSSYMLDWISPNLYIWLLLNIYKDHLDWHKNFENYKNAKLNISSNSKYVLVNDDFKSNTEREDSIFTFWINWDYKYQENSFFINGEKIFDDSFIKLRWTHNMTNVSWVLWILDIVSKEENVKLDLKKIEYVLKDFAWLPHRQENIWTYAWITFIDDAISTTPESTIEAIKTFWKDIKTIFLWWTDRWYDFEELVEYLRKYNIKNIVLFPDSGNRIRELIDLAEKSLRPKISQECPNSNPFPVGEGIKGFNILETSSMKEAVSFAYKFTARWKVCLLSTASPSYSLWKNYEEKWGEFKKEVEKVEICL